MPFLDCFSKFCKTGTKTCLGRARKTKNQFGRSKKKKVDKVFENFLKIRPPRENPRSAPAWHQCCFTEKFGDGTENLGSACHRFRIFYCLF